MGSELCKTCIHTKVCMHDKNLVGDVFVMGHPMMFDNDKLYEQYKEREKQGFPCEDYMSAEPKKGKWINHRCDDGHHIADCNLCGETMQWWDEDVPNFCSNCGADMRGEEDETHGSDN